MFVFITTDWWTILPLHPIIPGFELLVLLGDLVRVCLCCPLLSGLPQLRLQVIGLCIRLLDLFGVWNELNHFLQ